MTRFLADVSTAVSSYLLGNGSAWQPREPYIRSLACWCWMNPPASVDAVQKSHVEALTAIDYQLTILLVAHRFTTICHAEKIIVLDGGKVVGCGDHATLLKSCKFYADMFHAQNSYN